MLKNVTDYFELYQMLDDKYGSRFVCDPFSAIAGNIQGFIDKKKVSITFKPNYYVLISTASTSREILDELSPIFKKFMGGEEPICIYDLQCESLEVKDSMPTMEWDIKNPEGRLKDIINGRAFSDNAKIHNLKLFGSRKVEDYIESLQDKDEEIKNTRIYGVYPGNIYDVEAINNLSEVDLFFAIDTINGYISRCRQIMAHGGIEEIDLTEEQYTLEYMMYQTKKFGVELPEPTIDKHIQTTPSYNAWYDFYYNHFKYDFTDKQWNDFLEAQENGQDISAFMPTGKWTDILVDSEKPVEKTLK